MLHRPRLIILDGHRSHITLEFCEYYLVHNIALFCLPPHSTDMLQPLDVGLFGPLQHYYGKAADNHMRETRTGVVKGTFWTFYSAGRVAAYTTLNIKSAWRKTGIHPFNPDAVFTQLPTTANSTSKTPNIATPLITRTPRNRREVRHYTNAAISMARLGNTHCAISILRSFAHVAETALFIAEIKSIETEDIRRRYAGRVAA